MEGRNVLGTSRIGPKYRITLVKTVQEKLGADVGDMIVFWEDERGDVILTVSKRRNRLNHHKH